MDLTCYLAQPQLDLARACTRAKTVGALRRRIARQIAKSVISAPCPALGLLIIAGKHDVALELIRICRGNEEVKNAAICYACAYGTVDLVRQIPLLKKYGAHASEFQFDCVGRPATGADDAREDDEENSEDDDEDASEDDEENSEDDAGEENSEDASEDDEENSEDDEEDGDSEPNGSDVDSLELDRVCDLEDITACTPLLAAVHHKKFDIAELLIEQYHLTDDQESMALACAISDISSLEWMATRFGRRPGPQCLISSIHCYTIHGPFPGPDNMPVLAHLCDKYKMTARDFPPTGGSHAICDLFGAFRETCFRIMNIALEDIRAIGLHRAVNTDNGESQVFDGISWILEKYETEMRESDVSGNNHALIRVALQYGNMRVALAIAQLYDITVLASIPLYSDHDIAMRDKILKKIHKKRELAQAIKPAARDP